MECSPSELISEIEKARRKVRKSSAQQIRSKTLKMEIRNLAQNYFNSIRPTLNSINRDSDIAVLDESLKKLIELTHISGAKTTYLSRLGAAKKLLVSLDADLTAQISIEGPNSLYDTADRRIVDTLQSILPSAASSYQQALQDLHSSDRLSYRGPATDLREALRETLDHLAPDKDVKGMDGFKQNPNVSGPTMKQKVQYILKMRERSSSEIGSAASTVSLIDEMIGTFVRSVYTRSNVSTHTPTDRDEVLRLRHYVRLAFVEVLEIKE